APAVALARAALGVVGGDNDGLPVRCRLCGGFPFHFVGYGHESTPLKRARGRGLNAFPPGRSEPPPVTTSVRKSPSLVKFPPASIPDRWGAETGAVSSAKFRIDVSPCLPDRRLSAYV